MPDEPSRIYVETEYGSLLEQYLRSLASMKFTWLLRHREVATEMGQSQSVLLVNAAMGDLNSRPLAGART